MEPWIMKETDEEEFTRCASGSDNSVSTRCSDTEVDTVPLEKWDQDEELLWTESGVRSKELPLLSPAQASMLEKKIKLLMGSVPSPSKTKITFITKSMTVVASSWKLESLALHCKVAGDELKYSWTRNGVPIYGALGVNGWTHSFGGAVTAADSGIYNCSASSRYGDDWKQLHLRVLDIPRFWLKPVPAIIMPYSLLARSVGLHLVPPSSTGNSPITSYEVTCRPDVEYRSYVKDTVQRFSVTSVTVTGLQPATKYSCWYRAENAVGISFPSPILKLNTPESPPGKPENLSTVSSSAGHVTTFFKPMSPALTHGVLTGYQITFNATECITHQDCPCQQYNCSLHGSALFHESKFLSVHLLDSLH
ncbi:cell adhesion molecule Dscam2-like [Sycon ciliatum]|uniref:cell adhesion molecule Dscam2-like n=1 Tax=Sycon ciliatum TaxID=27933 RepID=UPI0031F659D2